MSSPSYSSTALETVLYCYNATTSCNIQTVSEPITEVDAYTIIGVAAGSSRQQTKFDKYGNVTYSAQYDFGATSPTVATTNTMAVNGSGNCSGIGATINNKVCSSTTIVGGNTVAASKFAYDAHGNVLTAYVSPNGGTSYLSNPTVNSYNPNGTPLYTYDLAGNKTSYAYSSASYTGSPSNLPFATSRTKGGLTTYSTWNSTGGVKLTDKDANGNVTTYGYDGNCGSTADPWWRVGSITDPLSNEVCKSYSATSFESSYEFNSNNSIQNVITTLDGYGRPINVQKQQSPSATNYDTTSTSRNFSGVNPTVFKSNPCSAASGSRCSTYGPTSTFNMFGQLMTSVQSGSNATVADTYAAGTAGYDTKSVLSPAPSGENTKASISEVNGLGWPTVSCAVSSSASGNVSCGVGGFTANGILTTTIYSSATGSTTVKSCRGPSNQQCRSVTEDGMGRVTSKTTPEGGTWNYYYDTAGCTGGAASAGNLTCVKDPNGNVLNYFYDGSNRLTEVNANGSACRWFYYDNSSGYLGALPTGISLSNQYGRTVEAATDGCQSTKSSSTLLTDLWWNYDGWASSGRMGTDAKLDAVLQSGDDLHRPITHGCELCQPESFRIHLRPRWRGTLERDVGRLDHRRGRCDLQRCWGANKHINRFW